MKKLVSLLLASCVGLSMATSVVKAEEKSNIVVTTKSFTASKNKIEGAVNIVKKGQLVYENHTEQVGDKWIYKGVIVAKITAADLFKSFYDKYTGGFNKATLFGRRIANLVMYSEKEKFPSMECTLTLPSTYKLGQIKTQTTTATVSSIAHSAVVEDKENAKQSVTLTFNLGSWNDYVGFFKLYEQDEKNSEAYVKVEVPFEVEVAGENALPEDKMVTVVGKCALYKYGGIIFHGRNIVNITAHDSISLFD